MPESKSFTVTDTRGKRAIEEQKEEAERLAKKEEQKNKDLLKKARDANYIVPIKPRGDRMLVRNDAPIAEYKGLTIPDSAKRRTTTGIIIDIGAALANNPELKVGVRVLFGRHDGTPIDFGGHKDLTMLNESEIRAIITKPIDEIELEFGDGGAEG